VINQLLKAAAGIDFNTFMDRVAIKTLPFLPECPYIGNYPGCQVQARPGAMAVIKESNS